ncbi:ricin-type beta-trefoil lectin domain protein [Streptomyces sp. NPDC097619]|uniref:ricin-type beta-trefoil lectin domain protein n=1 Tax=Streptomyces sp. NPDC097619 TaxID=3157228 RepID=UPI0033187BF2
MTTALGLTLLASPFGQAATPSPAPTGPAKNAPTADRKAADRTAVDPAARAVREALRTAKRTGRPVTVPGLTTEATETVAAPDGRTLSVTSHAQPVRVKRGGAWRTLDATLRTGPDGTVVPAATGAALALSGGGTGPLATITTGDGKQLAVTAPFALPKPSLSGDTATYAGVLPDVDLKVTALKDGGWREVIVVKTAEAAADPRLASLRFPVRTKGLKLTADKAGALTVKDAGGKVRMQSPPSLQWDSTTAAVAPAGTAAALKGAAVPSAAKSARPAQAAPVRSSAARPGDGAKVAKMTVTASDTALVLEPDRAALGKGTGPWYLDPTVTVTGGRQVNAQVQENHKTTANVNTLSALGVGYCGYSNCTGNGRYRSYYQIGIPSELFSDSSRGTAQISSATLFAQVTSASAPDTVKNIGLWGTGTIGGGTTWNNQPCGTGSVMAGCTKVGTFSLKGTGTITYDVKGWMQNAANGRWPHWTVGFAAENEMDMYQRHHLGPDPYITINYDVAPTIWWPRTAPTPGFADTGSHNDCRTPNTNGWENAGWVGANQNIRLTASVWSPIGHNELKTGFHVWDDQDPGYNHVREIQSGAYSSPEYSLGGLTDGHQYGWAAGVNDGWLSSDSTDACYFRVDKTPPAVTITSDDFPASGTLNVKPNKKFRQEGVFRVTGSDPAPSTGLHSSGPACIRWTDNPTPVTGWSCDDPGVIRGSGGEFRFTPRNWGTNVLFAQAMDKAGNYSQPFPYTFYAPWDPSTGAAVPGDLTNDGRGDILDADPAGNLRVLTADNDPTTAQAAPLGLAPQGTSWKDVRTTHRGALRAMGVDDAFAVTKANPTLAKNLYVYMNSGTGAFSTYTALDRPEAWATTNGAELDEAPAGWKTDWSETSQILALGALKAKLSSSDVTRTTTNTSLLTVEQGNLWLYRSAANNSLDAAAVKVSGTGDWDGYELINPGPASGTQQPTLWTRSLADGTIRAYPIKTKADTGRLDLSGLASPGAGTVIMTGMTPQKYPRIGSVGDANKDGVADLYAIEAGSERLKFWEGRTDSSSAVTGFTAPSDQGSTASVINRFKLDSAVDGKTPDAFGKTPGRITGGVSFTDDTVNGTTTKVATFNGSDGVITADELRLDTEKSFSVSLWTKPNVLNDGVVISQDNGRTSGFMVWPATLGNGNVSWRLGMARADDGWPYDLTDVNANAARVQAGVWTKLTVSHNAATGQLALYVNDALAATGFHYSKFATRGPIVLGRYQNGGQGSNHYNGSIADVVITDRSVDPAGTEGQIATDAGAGACLDVSGGVSENGRTVQIWGCNDSVAQKWTAGADGSLRILGRCLDLYGSATHNGAQVVLWDCHGGWNQKWIARADGSFLNPTTGRCLDVPNGNTANGTRPQLYDCNNTRPQRWHTTPAA